MAVSDYQSLMAPSLTALQDGKARTARQVRDAVASAIALSGDDQQATIPSGARRFDSRVHWAVTYMAQAGLVRRPRRGFVEITDRGREVLAKNLERIDNGVLSWFPEFLDFKRRAKDQEHADAESSPSARPNRTWFLRTRPSALLSSSRTLPSPMSCSSKFVTVTRYSSSNWS